MTNSRVTVYDVNPLYVHLKKHFCPQCGAKLAVRKHCKTIDRDSPEAENSYFNNEYGTVKEVLYCVPYFFCDACSFETSLKEMQAYEKAKKLKKRRNK